MPSLLFYFVMFWQGKHLCSPSCLYYSILAYICQYKHIKSEKENEKNDTQGSKNFERDDDLRIDEDEASIFNRHQIYLNPELWD